MRAKSINEVQNFEKGIHPKQALGIGGISLGMERYNMKKKFKEDWNFLLLTLLDGKTISAHMNKVRGNGFDKDPYYNGWGNYTVKVKEWELDEMGEDGRSIFITSDDGDRYILPIDDKKIYIENAR
jgi:hypothetical protein